MVSTSGKMIWSRATVIYTLAPLICLFTMHFNTGITNPFRKHLTMPTYKNWSCILTLHVRAEHFKHFPLHSTHYQKGYRSFLILCPTTPLHHPSLKPIPFSVTQCHAYTHHLLPRCVPYPYCLHMVTCHNAHLLCPYPL